MWAGDTMCSPASGLPTTSPGRRDSTLLSCLAYQVGAYRLLGSKDLPKSRLIQKLEAGNRDIYKEYISFRCYKGRVIPSIEKRRKVEYMLLFEK